MHLTSTDGTLIGYETRGAGPAVVLVDGALCHRGGGPMRPLAAELSDDATVLLYDRRGRGESGDTSPYAVEREIDDLAVLVDAAGGAAVLVGISSGGALALLAAGRLGAERVPALAVYEPPYLPEELRATLARYPDELGAALARSDRDLAVTLFLRQVGLPEPAIAGARQSPDWAGMTALAPTLGYDAAVMGDSAVPADLARALEVPLLALAGGASPDFLQYGARTLAGLAVRGEFDVLPGQGHQADPAVLGARLRSFMRDWVGG